MSQVRAVRPPGLAASSPARDHIHSLMRGQLEAIRAHESGTRLRTDPEGLHKMRVSRLRAILGAVQDMFESRWLGALRSELDWLGRA